MTVINLVVGAPIEQSGLPGAQEVTVAVIVVDIVSVVRAVIVVDTVSVVTAVVPVEPKFTALVLVYTVNRTVFGTAAWRRASDGVAWLPPQNWAESPGQGMSHWSAETLSVLEPSTSDPQ